MEQQNNHVEDTRMTFDEFKAQVLADFRIASMSRQASLLGRKEVLTGKAKFGIFGDGKEVAQLQPGDFFGEMSLFDDQPRSATVVTLTDCTLLTLERDRFSTLVLQRPDVLLQICKMFGSRLRETNRRLLAA